MSICIYKYIKVPVYIYICICTYTCICWYTGALMFLMKHGGYPSTNYAMCCTAELAFLHSKSM